MTGFDYGVIAIVGVSLLLGVWRGVVSELIALAAWVLGILAARAIGAEVGDGLYYSLLAEPALRMLAGCATVFFGVLVLMALGRLLVRGMIRALGLTLSDRLLGLLFGLARGVLIVLILVGVGGMTSLPKEPWWSAAHLAPPCETAVLAMKHWLPETIASRIHFK